MPPTTSSVDRLSLLGDNIKLSLLERKRASSLQLEPSPETDREIQHSLDTLLQGIEQLEREQAQLEESGEAYPSPSLMSALTTLLSPPCTVSNYLHPFTIYVQTTNIPPPLAPPPTSNPPKTPSSTSANSTTT
ncbi:hypothetical protein BJ508DRAFT_419472 [Ascobolus immersus RN42]|uniref:Uncharacterized protein n=1 Tax=Ascobolus immersus RN42 TaxID=1160509 RepID=A0A3N4HJT9_ASCIM|nr:hypothetical protein BJ508DRAFT_419472 [Ascobolus immersus RN42]